YFGAIATLAGLRPLLARGTNPSAIAISSNSTSTQANVPAELVEACLGDDEARARELAGPAVMVGYPASKLALARWVRRQATTEHWIGSGTRRHAMRQGYARALDRCRHPPQRDRTGLDRDADDRRRRRLRALARRHLPGADRPC